MNAYKPLARIALHTLAVFSVVTAGTVTVYGITHQAKGADTQEPTTSSSRVSLTSSDTAEPGADSSSGGGILRVAAARNEGTESGSSQDPKPPVEPSDPNIEEENPDAPTFWGEPVYGKVVFIIDVSASMRQIYDGVYEDHDGNAGTNARVLDVVKYELVRMLMKFDDDISFDIVWLAGAEKWRSDADRWGGVKPNTDAWAGGLVEAKKETVEEAIQAVKDQQMWWGTPTYRALYRATHEYGDELSKIVLLSDGAPYPDAGSWDGKQQDAILADFPEWFEDIRGNGGKLVCVHVGQSVRAGTFMQDLAAANGGEYQHK